MRKLSLVFAAAAVSVTAAAFAGPAESCTDRRIVRFGETTETIARRCGVTPGAIERQNPGLHIGGVKLGTRINVPRPALPSLRIEIRGNAVISGGNRQNEVIVR